MKHLCFYRISLIAIIIIGLLYNIAYALTDLDIALDESRFNYIDNKNPKSEYQIRRRSADYQTDQGGICNVSSITTLLNRRLAADNIAGSFTVKEVLQSLGCKDIKTTGLLYSDKNGNTSGTKLYQYWYYTGSTSNWCVNNTTYSNSLKTYNIKQINSTSIKNSTSKSNFYAYIVDLLHNHPEGIALRNTKADHVFVIYRYTYSNGAYQLYVKDPVGNYSGKLEGSHMWSASGKDLYTNIDFIVYINEAPKITSNPYLNITPTGTSSNGFYRIIKGAGNLFEYPYSDSSPKDQLNTNIEISSLTAKDVVEVVETVNNSLGYSWAKLRNGYFISMDNLEFLYSKEESVNLTATSTQKDLQTLPFADAIVGSTMSGSSMQVNLVEKYKNKYNNIWYKISSDQGGYFININNLSNITNNVTLTLKSGSTWPGDKNSATGYPRGELEQGKGFGLRGVIESNENITKVVGSITNLSTGANVSAAGSPQTVTPNAETINIKDSNINNKLLFDKLGNGSYRYTVTATTASGYTKTLIDEAFTVGSSTIPTLKVENIDIWYWGENVINGTTLEYDDSDIGYQCSISAAVSPDSASNNITWSNSNSNVVTLDAANYNFVVKGFGTTTITVSSTDGSNIKESITVEVTCRHLSSTWEIIQEPTYTSTGRRIKKCSICNETIATEDIPVLAPINVTSVTLSTHAVTLAPNQTYQLFVTVLPINATYQNCRWQSSNPDVATVSSNGLVTAISAGSANIICRSEKDDGTLDIATITVEPYHGTCGDALTWSLDNNTLTISGNGDMYVYAYTNNQPPWYAMRNKITSLVINNGVTRIGSDAFYNCYNLVNISLPNSLLTIMDDAFAQCTSLVDVNLPSSITRIDSGAFADCTSLANINIPDGVVTLNGGTFKNCNLQYVYIPRNVATIHAGTFTVSKLNTLYVYKNTVGAAFAQAYNIAYEYLDSVMDNPDLTLPSALIIIEEEAFAGNPAEWIKLSAKVTTIGPRAFADCMNLTEIYIPETATSISATAFEGVPAGLTIYTKSGSYAAFYATNNGYDVHILPSKTAAQ